jgi:hypothetical protein
MMASMSSFAEVGTDPAVLALASRGGIGTIEEVIARMRELDGVLPDQDGLKWFNWLYLLVTEEIARDLAAERWADPEWLQRLDVEFAQLYFEAIALWTADRARCPRAWVPLFERRFNPHVARVQFGLAGMNAHINRDLPVAVMRTCQARGLEPRRGTPQHADYERVNTILEQVEIRAIQELATGIIGQITTGLGQLDDVIAMWKVRKARDAAWTNSQVLWSLRPLPDLGAQYLATLDSMTGYAGRGLLIPTQ